LVSTSGSTACAEAHDVLDEATDVVVIATGGLPNVGHFTGSELATTWCVPQNKFVVLS
jgi:hypothetical protein